MGKELTMARVCARHYVALAWIAIWLCVIALVPLAAHAQADTPVTHTELVPILLSVIGALLAALCSLFGGIVLSKASNAQGTAAEALRSVTRVHGMMIRQGERLAQIDKHVQNIDQRLRGIAEDENGD